MTAMSGLPIDIVDTGAGSLYGLSGGSAALAPAELRRRQRDVKRAGLLLLQPFRVCAARCARGAADPELGRHGPGGSDWHRYRQPRQQRAPRTEANQLRFFARQTFPGLESRSIEFRAEAFNLLNQVNLANPISDLNAVPGSGGSLDPNTGRIINPGSFGKIISASNNPRLVQLALKFTF